MVRLTQYLHQVHVDVVKVVEDALDLLHEEEARLFDVWPKLDAQEQFELVHSVFRRAHDFEFHEESIEEVVKFDQIDVHFRVQLLLHDVLGEDFAEILRLDRLLLLLVWRVLLLLLVFWSVEHLLDAKQEVECDLGQHAIVQAEID